jgi:hypothetical protein
LQKLTHLVSLQVSDHMPVDLGELRIFFEELSQIVKRDFEVLHPVFGQMGASQFYDLLYRIEVGGFCNDDEGYF